ncbi:hypothetical protein [Rhodococcus sp. AW25M09]|uniref:hypothetical protein n=1 Tax=Rhodococcus sp. AW25M09 TaxID=1268303 RepID=UPI00034CD840|nr:hypothetical protein [Rhodococcus sp. AW25M09]
MSIDSGWRRELHRIRDDHRRAMARAADMVGRAQTPTAVVDRRTSGTANRPDGEGGPIRGSVLQPAHLDRREPTQQVETEPEDRPRSWLV